MSPEQQSYRILGTPRTGGVLIVADHASNHVPPDIDLGVSAPVLDDHVAVDRGVADIIRLILAGNDDMAAFVASTSRLVCDLNREPAACVVEESDGIAIPGNVGLMVAGERIARFHRPYHDALAALLVATRPALILSLHSFTPTLASRPDEVRPWEIAVLYNDDDRAARIAFPIFAKAGMTVGDQQPYSGLQLNYTMNRHGEANGIPYLGIETRQDIATDRNRQPGLARLIAGAAKVAAATLGRQ